MFSASTKVKDLAIKLSLLSVLFFIGCLFTPIFAVVFLLTAIFIILENDINSFSYILFFMPLITLFKFNNSFGLTYWFLLVCVFIAVRLITNFMHIIKKKEKINLPLAIILGVVALYLLIPFKGNFNFISIAESFVWLTLFYIIINEIKNIGAKRQTLVSSIGFLFSSFVGFFATSIPYLSQNITQFYAGSLLRFSGAFVNPNIYYSWGIICLAMILVLMFNKKLSLAYTILLLPILICCYASISKTFIVCYLVALVLIAVSVLVKFSKHKAKVGLIVLICTIFTMGIMLNYTKTYIDRFFDTNLMPIDSVVQLKPNGDELEFVETGADNSDAETMLNTMTTGRLLVWKVYFNNIKAHNAFVFGFGINTANGLLYENSHNTYLQILYEVGIVGYLLIIAILIYYLKKTKFMVFKTIGTAIYLPVAILLCNFMTENLFLSQMGNMMLILSFIALVALNPETKDNIDCREVIVKDEKEIFDKNFTLAVLTPAYNRPELLKRVYASLENQTFKNFVWYIVDDGSKDPQDEVVNELKAKGKIKIEFIKKENGGRHSAINEGVKHISEPAVVIVDNDDYLTDDAVETISKDWGYIKDREDFCGIGYLKELKDGEIVGTKYTAHGIVDSFVNERHNNKTYGDKAEVFKTEILKQFPFPTFEGEKFLSETTLWCKMSGKYRLVFFNKSIYVCEYLEDGLSNNVHKRLFNNPKGATACYKQLTTKEFNFQNKIKFSLLYIVYSFASKNGALETIKKSNNKFLTALLIPFGYLLFVYKKRKYKV